MARYKFLNVNPLGVREKDCVNRAIALALNEDYYIIKDKLQQVANLFECEKLCVCCYKYLLDEVYNLERIEEYKGITIQEFCELFPIGIYIIRCEGHLTCAVDGVINDIWDCTQELVDIVWCVE